MALSDIDFDRIEAFHARYAGDTGVPAILLYTPNTYHYTLLGLHHLEQFLYILHQENNLSLAEISEDVFGIVPVLQYHKNPDPVNRLIDRILLLGDKAGVKNLSVGTGADIYSLMQMTGGFFDCNESNRSKLLQTFLNVIKITEKLGLSKINGHRVATILPDNFPPVSLQAFRTMTGNEDLDFGGIDPDTEITGAEAINLQLALMLQDASESVSSTTELMYQPGMEPCTIVQMERFLTILQANSDKPVLAHMDTGHVSAYGKDKKSADYDIISYADIAFPRWTVHFNALYNNEHRMPTAENIAQDLAARNNTPDPVRSPHPELYGNIYKWLRKIAGCSRVVQVSPEPKPEKLDTLIKEVEECWSLLQDEYKDSHRSHPKYHGILIPNVLYDHFIREFG
jgi:hypothetical protein